MLSRSSFQAIMVDAAMIDRHSGDVTLFTLVRQADVPVIALALDRTAQSIVAQADVVAVTSTEPNVIRQALGQVTQVPIEMDTGLLTPQVDDPLVARQIDEINTLFMLSKSLTEVLDLSEVLNRVVDAARHLTHAEEGMILLPEGDELYLRARVGMDVEVARNFRIKTRDSLAGQVFHTAKPILVGDRGPQKVKTEYFVNSLLYVPILLRGEVLGVLGVNNHTSDEMFTAHHQQLLENLSSFVAVAIQNARTHSESLARNRDLEALVSATQALNASLSLNDALQNICQQMTRTLQVENLQIYTWDRASEDLLMLARYDQAVWPAGRGPLIDLTQYDAMLKALRQAAEADSIAWLHRDELDDGPTSALMTEVGVARIALIPVYTDGHLLGVVRLFFVLPPPVETDSLVTEQIHDLALQAVADLLNSSDQVLAEQQRQLLADLLQTARADWCDVSLPLSSETALSVTVRWGHGGWVAPPYPSLSVADEPQMVTALTADQPLTGIAGGRHNAPGTNRLLAHTGARSVLVVPLIQNKRPEGVVVFTSTITNRVFEAREIMLARAVVGQAAISLENARLVHDLESSLTELRNTQKRLVQTARLSAMGELASVVAHQMNNPLTTIIVDTELMLLDEPPDSPRREALQAIARTGKRAANVARRLLAIARPPENDPTRDYIDIAESLRGVLSLLQTHVEYANIELNVRLPTEPLPPVRASKGRLDDIWLNLIMNAFDALHEHPNGRIVVTASLTDAQDEIVVTVEDNGPGISQEIQQQIFSPFFTTKPIGEGTGLGLHISREMAENAGGRITVMSQPGKFTRFSVFLPV